ncbi:MAG TPA: MarR family transcriptional regulator [Polyangia bacterium]|nr:MarR family transcriptional regulator [Polyangia bacterium]
MPKRSTSALKPVVDLLGKRLSTATILFHAAVADRMGVSVTDAKCRSLLVQLGPMTAGDLALRLQLTTGAVTGVIDRLERARLVRRVADPNDRRRVVVELVVNRKRDLEIARLFEPMGRRVVALTAGYSAKERTIIFEFLTQACEILEEETVHLRAKR